MRYLVVPSRDTENWKQNLQSLGWLSREHNILQYGENRAIPLSPDTPKNLPDDFSGLEIVNIDTDEPEPTNHIDYLRNLVGTEVFDLHIEDWPKSYDQLGDLIIIKISQDVSEYFTEIGMSLLAHVSAARLVLVDNGVKGDYRVRQLEVIGSKDSNCSTETHIKENGCDILIDPSLVYYSPRLANERARTLDAAILLQKTLGRPIRIVDPYAGVGPSLVPLIHANLIEAALANDINPSTTKFLIYNLSKAGNAVDIRCVDARTLTADKSLNGFFDMLLVNIPFSTLDHLPYLLPLLSRKNPSLLRAWCVMGESQTSDLNTLLEGLLRDDGRKNQEMKITEIGSYSPTHKHLLIEAWLSP